MNQTVIILDFGGQYKELIARRVRELGVYSVILPGSTPAARIKEMAPIGLIFTGGPDSVYKEGAPDCEDEILRLGVPILGICYGMQLLAHKLGGRVAPCEKSEYGTLNAEFDTAFPLFFDVTDPRVLICANPKWIPTGDGRGVKEPYVKPDDYCSFGEEKDNEMDD